MMKKEPTMVSVESLMPGNRVYCFGKIERVKLVEADRTVVMQSGERIKGHSFALVK